MKKITLLFFFFPLLLTAQTVTTISTNSGVTDELKFDADGNLLGADYTGSAVYKVTLPDGVSSIFSDGYNTPNGMAFDSNGTLYMADNQGNKIYKILPDGTPEHFVDMFNPSGIIFELDSDTLIATSYMGDKLVKIAPDSTMSDWSVGGELVGGPVGLCYDDEGNLYVGNFDNRKITLIHPDGSQEPITQGPTSGWLGFIAYTEGFIYGTLYSTHKIFRYDLEADTIPEVILGSNNGTVDGDASVAKFSAPNGILASPYGDTLYVSDFNTSNIRMITNLDGTPPSSDAEVLKSVSFNFSPNPFNSFGQISFEMTASEMTSIELRDAEGKLHRYILENEKLAAGKHAFEILDEALSNGIYYVVLKTGNGEVLTKKIIRSE